MKWIILGIIAPLFCLVVAFVVRNVDRDEVAVSLQAFVDRKTYEWFIEDCLPSEEFEGKTSKPVGSGDIQVVYASDAKGFPSLMSSMLSLSRHLESPDACVIHLIVPGHDMDQAKQLIECFQVELDDLVAVPVVRIHELQEIPLNLSSFREVWSRVWPSGAPLLTPISFVQIYLEDYLPSLSRVVWLSINTIVKVDVSQLYHMKMTSTLAAAKDSKCVTWRTEYMPTVDQVNRKLLDNVDNIDARTFNSEILVIDLDRWRKNIIKRKLSAWMLYTHGVKGVQLALNLEFGDKYDVLDWRWNVMGLTMVPPRHCIDKALILHWTGIDPLGKNISDERLLKLHRELRDPYLPTCIWKVAMLESDPDEVTT